MQELDLSVDLNAASATEQEAAWTSSIFAALHDSYFFYF